MRKSLAFTFLVGLGLGFAAFPANALTIQLDYSHDIANGGNFFGNNPVAKAALETAAANLGAAILPTLGAVPTDVYTGLSISEDTTATINWRLTYKNPVTGANLSLNTFSFEMDVVKVFVGMRRLTGNTLGEGGPGGAAITVNTNGFEDELSEALSDAEEQSNESMSRGGGPVMGTLEGSITLGDTEEFYDLEYGAMIGNLWFDSDTNNNNVADTPAELNNFWHFDHTTPVAAGKNDFYTVALHELIHTLGFGTSVDWDDNSDGTTWLGVDAKILNGGSGTNLITLDGHIREGLMSQRVSDGVMQEALMDPSIIVGTRKYLTYMDLAFLSDIGYDVIPEPSAAGLILVGAMSIAGRRRRD